MMLRPDATPRAARVGLALLAMVGVLCGVLVAAGNPGNMGICGACFLRDTAGSLGLFKPPAPTIFRPELAGIVLGALGLSLLNGRFAARSGSHAATRLIFGVWMGIGALVFLGCPFRMLQRLGGGDLNAWIGALGFIGGVGVGVLFERRGYRVGRTAQVPAPVGLLGPATFLLLLLLFLVGGVLFGPGPDAPGPPAHAPWLVALLVAGVAGAALSATGFCAVSAARQVFTPGRRMLAGAGLLVAGYALVSLIDGRLAVGTGGQPIAHSDALWNILALALVGLTGVLSGGCPVRQVVMTGEGNGDAFVTCVGLLLGGALSHTLGLASSGAGPTSAGRIAVVIGLGLSLAYGLLMSGRHVRE
jgi:YedE family putative selenium metabolism protein